MQIYAYMLAAVVVGAVITAQPPMNAVLARAVGNAYGATAVSIGVAFISILAVTLFFGRGDLSIKTLASVPWWVYLAGLGGTIFVGAGVVIAPVTGALLFFVCIVAGQLIGSTLFDHLGAFQLETRPVTGTRIAGIALALIGAVMVSRG